MSGRAQRDRGSPPRPWHIALRPAVVARPPILGDRNFAKPPNGQIENSARPPTHQVDLRIRIINSPFGGNRETKIGIYTCWATASRASAPHFDPFRRPSGNSITGGKIPGRGNCGGARLIRDFVAILDQEMISAAHAIAPIRKAIGRAGTEKVGTVPLRPPSHPLRQSPPIAQQHPPIRRPVRHIPRLRNNV